MYQPTCCSLMLMILSRSHNMKAPVIPHISHSSAPLWKTGKPSGSSRSRLSSQITEDHRFISLYCIPYFQQYILRLLLKAGERCKKLYFKKLFFYYLFPSWMPSSSAGIHSARMKEIVKKNSHFISIISGVFYCSVHAYLVKQIYMAK